MRERPEDFDEGLLRTALKAWGIDAPALTYAPVGFGDFHWVAGDRFVTVADVRRRSYDALRAALDTAAALRGEAGLEFVVAPLRDAEGATLRRLDRRYAMSVFPYEEGRPGEFGDEQDADERAAAIDVLAALHGTPPPLPTPVSPVQPAGRALLEGLSRGDDGLPWLGGPYSEPARDLVAGHARTLRGALEEFDRLAERPGEPVVTHGEPHPGNLLRAGGRLLLVDWDTVGMAVPERDLWLVAETGDDLARYADATGHTPDQGLLRLHRLRWALDDVAEFVQWFRAPHARTPDAEVAWRGLQGTLEQLAHDG